MGQELYGESHVTFAVAEYSPPKAFGFSLRFAVDFPSWRHHPIHPLVVFVTGKFVSQAIVVGHPHTQSGRGEQKSVVIPPSKPQPPSTLIKGYTGHQHDIERGGIHNRQIRCWL
jgi:hypothetical protein